MSQPTAVDAEELVREVGGLITLPDVYVRINRLLDDPQSSVQDIARVVEQDPSFSVRLLRIANSPLYNRGRSIGSAATAVSLVGTGTVRNLALSLSVAGSFDGMPNELVSMENFWRHSLLTGLAARLLARATRRCDPDVLFTAGLLHDIGALILFNREPEGSRQALLKVLDEPDTQVFEAEQAVMGTDHAAVGAALARQWQLPEVLVECIALHHAPELAVHHPREVALLAIANILAQLAEIDSLDPADAPPIPPEAWARSGLDPDEALEEIIRETRNEMNDLDIIFTQADS